MQSLGISKPNRLAMVLVLTIGDGRTLAAYHKDGTIDRLATIKRAALIFAGGPFTLDDVCAALEADQVEMSRRLVRYYLDFLTFAGRLDRTERFYTWTRKDVIL